MSDEPLARVAATALPPTPKAADRDQFIDVVRSFSLLVVVAGHWVFAIIVALGRQYAKPAPRPT